MGDWIGTVVGNPFHGDPVYVATYLGLPLVLTLVSASLAKRVLASVIVGGVGFVSAFLYTTLYTYAHGLGSTISIGFMYALVIHTFVSGVAVAWMRRKGRTPTPPHLRFR